MKLSSSSRVSLSSHTISQDLDGETVLFNLDNEHYYTLNEVGTSMLNALNNSDTIEEAALSLIGEYDVEREQLVRDILDFVAKLTIKGLVKID